MTDLVNPAPVPDDFPRQGPGAVPGSQPKVLATLGADGRYYVGETPQARWVRWDNCEDLVQQLAAKCRKHREGKLRDLSEAAIVSGYVTTVLNSGWVTLEESHWMAQRLATVMGWTLT